MIRPRTLLRLFDTGCLLMLLGLLTILKWVVLGLIRYAVVLVFAEAGVILYLLIERHN